MDLDNPQTLRKQSARSLKPVSMTVKRKGSIFRGCIKRLSPILLRIDSSTSLRIIEKRARSKKLARWLFLAPRSTVSIPILKPHPFPLLVEARASTRLQLELIGPKRRTYQLWEFQNQKVGPWKKFPSRELEKPKRLVFLSVTAKDFSPTKLSAIKKRSTGTMKL